MRPLALALLLAAPCFAADPAPDPKAVAAAREALSLNFADGTKPADGAPKELAPASAAVLDLYKAWKADPKDKNLSKLVDASYDRLFAKKDRGDLLARARLTYGLMSQEDFEKSLKQQEAEAAKLPADQQKVIAGRLAGMKAAFGKMSEGDGGAGGAGGVKVAGKDEAARKAALDKYKATPLMQAVTIVKTEPPPPGGDKGALVEFAGVKLNAKQQARVGDEVSKLKEVLAADNLNGYVTETDKKYIVDAWGKSVARNVDAGGFLPNMKKTVNDFRDILLSGRESGDGTTRVAEHWGEMAVGTYMVGSWASLPASLLWNTFSITKGQLMRSYRYMAGTGPMPPAGNYWGEAMNKSLVTEAAAAGWASALPGAEEQKPLEGVSETLKLGEFAAFVGEAGLLGTAGAMKDRYSK